jgi:hypothetical protein
LLITRNKGRPSTKEEAEKKKEREVFEMVWLPEFNNQRDGTAGPSKEVHTALTGIVDRDSIFLDALDVQEALQVEVGKRVLLAVAWVCDNKCRFSPVSGSDFLGLRPEDKS